MPTNYTQYAQTAVDNLEANVDAIVKVQGMNAAQQKGIQEMYSVTNEFVAAPPPRVSLSGLTRFSSPTAT